MTYFNTNKETGKVLARSRERTENQDDRILAFFQRYPGKSFPTYLVRLKVMPNAPMTSVQRSITNLTDRGFLIKTENWAVSPYEKQVHTWILNPNPGKVEEVQEEQPSLF
jgi:hypothetical protein